MLPQCFVALVLKRSSGSEVFLLSGAPLWLMPLVTFHQVRGHPSSDCLPSYLPDDGEAGVQVGQATRGQRGAASGELQEGLPLVT